jgi:hypothetical protein
MSDTAYLRPLTRVRRYQIDDFIRRLVRMKEEAFRLGIYQTGHTLDEATRKVGWELAEILTGKSQRAEDAP